MSLLIPIHSVGAERDDAKCDQSVGVKVAVTSLKLEIRLHAYPAGMNTRSGTKAIFIAHLIGSCIRN